VIFAFFTLTFGEPLMSVERNLLISILKLTKEGPVLIENVKKEARIPATVALELLEKLQNEDLLYLNNGTIEPN
jgi:predicted transcriptional regulator